MESAPSDRQLSVSDKISSVKRLFGPLEAAQGQLSAMANERGDLVLPERYQAQEWAYAMASVESEPASRAEAFVVIVQFDCDVMSSSLVHLAWRSKYHRTDSHLLAVDVSVAVEAPRLPGLHLHLLRASRAG